ncbi:hypothetical protein AWB91_09020 [Mycobacterium paraense]|uniref:Ku domain-containing protein n=1 Tax=Mycobacterium paraense TaxID=767916 RepID=A0ABX3VSG1_9MYCO|nr:Ku protein [Mycobacterium paraense]ORW33258.1 hypothetical protein AWB91_09020 [Mycobacterium paraense]ORW34682.1 hypothetical protein AWB88_02760 [Mycobacterium paraense]
MKSKSNTTLDVSALLNVAVKVYAGQDARTSPVHSYHEGCGGEIGRQAYCKTCQETDPQTVKGITHGEDVVLVTDGEIAELRGTGTGMEIVKYVPAEQVSAMILGGGVDFLEPNITAKAGGKTALKAYVVLRDALMESDRVGIVRYTGRGVSHLAVLRVHGKVLVLQSLVWADQVRVPDFEVLARPIEIDPREAKLCRQLIEAKLGDFHHADYVDTYAQAVEALVEDKLAGGGASMAAVSSKDTGEDEVADLLAKLEASIKATETEQRPTRRRRRGSAA